MCHEDIPAFLLSLHRYLRAPVPNREALVAVLRTFAIPSLSDEIRQRSATCRTPVTQLFPVPGHLNRSSPHDYASTRESVCWCPTLSTLVWKVVATFATRTHGHHFREEVRVSFRLLDDEAFVELLLADPGALAAVLIRG